MSQWEFVDLGLPDPSWHTPRTVLHDLNPLRNGELLLHDPAVMTTEVSEHRSLHWFIKIKHYNYFWNQ